MARPSSGFVIGGNFITAHPPAIVLRPGDEDEEGDDSFRDIDDVWRGEVDHDDHPEVGEEGRESRDAVHAEFLNYPGFTCLSASILLREIVINRQRRDTNCSNEK